MLKDYKMLTIDFSKYSFKQINCEMQAKRAMQSTRFERKQLAIDQAVTQVLNAS